MTKRKTTTEPKPEAAKAKPAPKGKGSTAKAKPAATEKKPPASASAAPTRKSRPDVHYTRELADEICRRLAGGETLKAICRTPGMPTDTAVRLWALEDRDGFDDKYCRARKLGYEVWGDEVIDLSDDATGDYVETQDKDGNTVLKVNMENVQRSKLRVDSRKWFLAKVLPKIYGEKVTAEHTGANGEKLFPEDTSSRDLARAVLDILRSAKLADRPDNTEIDGAVLADEEDDTAPPQMRIFNKASGRLEFADA